MVADQRRDDKGPGWLAGLGSEGEVIRATGNAVQAALLFAGLGAVLAVLEIALIVGGGNLLLVGFFGATGAWAGTEAWRLWRRGRARAPLLAYDARGLYVPQVGLVSWQDVERGWCNRYSTSTTLAFDLNGEARRRLPLLSRARGKIGLGDLNFAGGILSIEAPDLLARMAVYSTAATGRQLDHPRSARQALSRPAKDDRSWTVFFVALSAFWGAVAGGVAAVAASGFGLLGLEVRVNNAFLLIPIAAGAWIAFSCIVLVVYFAISARIPAKGRSSDMLGYTALLLAYLLPAIGVSIAYLVPFAGVDVVKAAATGAGGAILLPIAWIAFLTFGRLFRNKPNGADPAPASPSDMVDDGEPHGPDPGARLSMDRLLERERVLRSLTVDWSTPQLLRTYEPNDAGHEDFDDDLTIMQSHGYRSEADSSGRGRMTGELLSSVWGSIVEADPEKTRDVVVMFLRDRAQDA